MSLKQVRFFDSRRKEAVSQGAKSDSNIQRAEEIRRTFKCLSQRCCVSLRRLTEDEIIRWTKRKDRPKENEVLPSLSLIQQSSEECNSAAESKTEKKVYSGTNQSEDGKVNSNVKEIDGNLDSCNKRKLSSDIEQSENQKKKIKHSVPHGVSKIFFIERDIATGVEKEDDFRDKEDFCQSVTSNYNKIVYKSVLNEGNFIKTPIKQENDQHLEQAEDTCKELEINTPPVKAISSESCSSHDKNTSSSSKNIKRSGSGNSIGSSNYSKKSKKSKKAKRSKKESRSSRSKSSRKDKKRKSSGNDKTSKNYNTNKETQSDSSQICSVENKDALLISNSNSSSNVEKNVFVEQKIFGIASISNKNSVLKNESKVKSFTSSKSSDLVVNDSDENRIYLNTTPRDPTQIFGIPLKSQNDQGEAIQSNTNSSCSSHNENHQEPKAKIRVRPPSELGIQSYDISKNSLSASSSFLPSDLISPLPSDSGNSRCISLNFLDKIPIPKNAHFSGYIDVSCIIDAKRTFLDELQLSKISKLSEIIHLAISDSVKKQVSISNAGLINSKELSDKEILRANKDFQYNIRCRAAEFCPLFCCLIKRNTRTYNLGSILVLFCLLCDNLIRIKSANSEFLCDVRFLINHLFRMGRFRDELINKIISMKSAPFMQCVNTVSEVLCLEYFKKLSEEGKNENVLPNNKTHEVVNNSTSVNNFQPSSAIRHAIEEACLPAKSKQPSFNKNGKKPYITPNEQLPVQCNSMLEETKNLSTIQTSSKHKKIQPKLVVKGDKSPVTLGNLVADVIIQSMSNSQSKLNMPKRKRKNSHSQILLDEGDRAVSNNNSLNTGSNSVAAVTTPVLVKPPPVLKLRCYVTNGTKKVDPQKRENTSGMKINTTSPDLVSNVNSTKTLCTSSVIVTSTCSSSSSSYKSLINSVVSGGQSAVNILKTVGTQKFVTAPLPGPVISTSYSNAVCDKVFTDTVSSNTRSPATYAKGKTNVTNSSHILLVTSSYPASTSVHPIVSVACTMNGISSGQKVATPLFTTASIGNHAAKATHSSGGSGSSSVIPVQPISRVTGIFLPSDSYNTAVRVPPATYYTEKVVASESCNSNSPVSSIPSNTRKDVNLMTSSLTATSTCRNNPVLSGPTSFTTKISSGITSASKTYPAFSAVISSSNATKGNVSLNSSIAVTTSVSCNNSFTGKSTSESPATYRPLLSIKPVERINREHESLQNYSNNKNLMEIKSTIDNENAVPKQLVELSNNHEKGANIETCNKEVTSLATSNFSSLDRRKSNDNLQNSSDTISDKQNPKVSSIVGQETETVPPKPKLIPINTEALRKNNSTKEFILLSSVKSNVMKNGIADHNSLEKLSDAFNSRTKNTLIGGSTYKPLQDIVPEDKSCNNSSTVDSTNKQLQDLVPEDKSCTSKQNSNLSCIEHNYSSSNKNVESFSKLNRNNSTTFNRSANFSSLLSKATTSVKVVKHNLPSILVKPSHTYRPSQSYRRYPKQGNVCHVAPLQKSTVTCSDIQLNNNSRVTLEGSRSSSNHEIRSSSLPLTTGHIDVQQPSKILNASSESIALSEVVSTNKTCQVLSSSSTNYRLPANSELSSKELESNSVNEIVKSSQSVEPNNDKSAVNKDSDHLPQVIESLSAKLGDVGQEKSDYAQKCKLNSSSSKVSVQLETGSKLLSEDSQKDIAPPSPEFVSCNPVLSESKDDDDDDVLFVTGDIFSPVITSVLSLNELICNEDISGIEHPKNDDAVKSSSSRNVTNSVIENPREDNSSLLIQSDPMKDKELDNGNINVSNKERLSNGEENCTEKIYFKPTQAIVDAAISSLLELNKESAVEDLASTISNVENLSCVATKENLEKEEKVHPESSSSQSTATASQIDEEDDDVIWVGDIPSDRPESSEKETMSSNNNEKDPFGDSFLVPQQRLERQCCFKKCTYFKSPLKTGTQVLICSRCRKVCYCSEKCQQTDWYESHRKICKEKEIIMPSVSKVAADYNDDEKR